MSEQEHRPYTGGYTGAGEERGTAVQVQEKAREVGSQVGEMTQDARRQAGGRAREEIDRRSTQAGEQVSSTADALRRTGSQLRDEGKEGPARVTDQVADRAERFGSYLQAADADRILRDVEDFGRRRPWMLAAAGATLGFLAARFLKASSARRYEEAARERYEPPVPERYEPPPAETAYPPAHVPTRTSVDPAPGATVGPEPGL